MSDPSAAARRTPSEEQSEPPGRAEPRSDRLTLVCASANPDKIAEFAPILAAAGVELLPRPDGVPEVVEDGGTLVANARLKAAALCQATGLPAVADDTGLEVDALDGAPGVDTAYYAGPTATYDENVDKLLAELARLGALAPAERRARFRTVALVVWPDGSETVADGTVEGAIAPERRGSGGWGYDPVFAADDLDAQTFSEAGMDAKTSVSGRGRAFRALAAQLAAR